MTLRNFCIKSNLSAKTESCITRYLNRDGRNFSSGSSVGSQPDSAKGQIKGQKFESSSEQFLACNMICEKREYIRGDELA